MLFGENKEFGLMQEGFGLKVVKLGKQWLITFIKIIHAVLLPAAKEVTNFVDFTTWEIFPMTGNSNGLLI